MTKELVIADSKSEMMNTLAVINEKLKEIKKLESSKNATDGNFRWNPNYTSNTPVNIFKCTDIQLLISIYASLRDKNQSYEEAVKELGLSEYPVYTWQSYTFEAWANDLKVRMAIVNQDAIATKLKKDKETLEEFMDKSDRLSAVLGDMNYLED